ncbi:hypothetical protein TNCT_290041 [Trichonephila clavata]|uniref:Uncharacterized protein n=1 Tax=Trichonephila clavata TaxID=2740835 RepID=A0A8X6I7G9_TRICU|nr:hypothetical protein TNCT_290041 [Trichonephila clavata]
MFQAVKGFKKEDLKYVAAEIGEEISSNTTISGLKDLILNSNEYKNDPESLQEFFRNVVSERKLQEAEKNKEQELEIRELEAEKELELARIQCQNRVMDIVHILWPKNQSHSWILQYWA